MINDGNNPLDTALSLVRVHAGQNGFPPELIPQFINQVHESIQRSSGHDMPGDKPLIPAVPIADSVTEFHIVCLEDGTKHAMMKRYLMRRYQMTPDEYRRRWNLPEDYPMTASGYSERKRLMPLPPGMGPGHLPALEAVH